MKSNPLLKSMERLRADSQHTTDFQEFNRFFRGINWAMGVAFDHVLQKCGSPYRLINGASAFLVEKKLQEARTKERLHEFFEQNLLSLSPATRYDRLDNEAKRIADSIQFNCDELKQIGLDPLVKDPITPAEAEETVKGSLAVGPLEDQVGETAQNGVTIFKFPVFVDGLHVFTIRIGSDGFIYGVSRA